MDNNQRIVTFLITIVTLCLSSASSGSADKTYFLYTDCRHANPPKIMDKAWVTVVAGRGLTSTNTKIQLYGQVSICEKCSPLYLLDINLGKNCTFLTDTKFDVTFSLKNTTSQQFVYSETRRDITEHSRFTMLVWTASGNVSFTLIQTSYGPDTFIPIYVSMGIVVGVSVLWILLRYAYRKGLFHRLAAWFRKEDDIDMDLGSPPRVTIVNERPTAAPPTAKVSKPRLRSLDAFRGLSLTIMMFVNYGGGGYWFFAHSYWNGLTVADLVFPWFTWIMGTSIALSFNSLLKKGIKRRSILLKVIRRTAILFALGLLINSAKGPVDLTHFRIPGVLQRLAFSYFCVAILETMFATADDTYTLRWWAPVRDLLPFWPEWLVALSFLAAHVLLTFLLPVEGCPTGYIGPGGLHDNSTHYNCTGGAARAIDQWVFGDSHIYQHPTCKNTYRTAVPYDPEGILGSLTSVFICFLGLQAGKIFIMHKNWGSRIIRFTIWGLVLGLVAGGLCLFSQNDGIIPVNKNLWSVSFILTMASTAFLLLTVFYVVIDVYKIWSGTPFHFPGMNSIVVYVCHEVFSDYFPVTWKALDTHASQMALQAWGVSLWVVMAALLYYRGIFIAI